MATIADLSVSIGVDGNLDQGLKQAAKSVGDLGKEVEKASDKIEKASEDTSKGLSAIAQSTRGLDAVDASLKQAAKSVGDLGAETIGASSQIAKASSSVSHNFAEIGHNVGSIKLEVLVKMDSALEQATKSTAELGNEFRKATSKLDSFEKEQGEFKRQVAELEEANRRLKNELDEVGKKGKKGANDAKDGFLGLNGALTNVAGTIAGAFTVGALMQFGSAVVSTTANFQKMEAVLTNTLGSSSAAQNAMLMIQDIAAKTPFSVEQLTESFVKLANRGIVPTGDQITKLGDLAASTGKDFDQLTEAMLDAMTGEFERLKEFGVTAAANGDKVAFTFKGVTTEVQKTDTAIKDYILSLGETQGVTGSMASISETLGGKLSNLGDSFDQLFLTIGNGNKGVLASSVDGLNTYIQKITTAVKSIDQLRSEAISKSTKDYLGVVGDPKNLQEFAEAQAYLNDKTNQYKIALSGAEKQLAKLRESNIQNMMGGSNAEAIEKQSKVVAGFKREIEAVGKALSQVKESKVKFLTPEEVQPQITTLETLKAKLKGLQDQQETLNVSDSKGLITKNQEIKKLEDLIKKYEELGTAKSKSGPGLSPIAAPNFDNIKPVQDFGSLPDSSDYDSITNSITQQNAALAQQALMLGMVQPAFMALGTTMGEIVTPEMQRVMDITAEMGSFFEDNFVAAVDMVGQALGGLFTGQLDAGDFFKLILTQLADFAARYGQTMIALGLAQNVAVPGSGIPSMIAGAALIVVAKVAGAAISSSGKKGGGAMPSGGGSYKPPTARSNSDTFAGPGANNGGTVEFKIRGTELVGVLRKQGDKNGN